MTAPSTPTVYPRSSQHPSVSLFILATFLVQGTMCISIYYIPSFTLNLLYRDSQAALLQFESERGIDYKLPVFPDYKD